MSVNVRRIAGVVNLVAAVVFITVGISRRQIALIVIGSFFLLIGILRLRQVSSGPPPG